MLKNGIFCKMVILVVFKVFQVVKNLEILTQIVPDVSIYPYSYSSKRSLSGVPLLTTWAIKSCPMTFEGLHSPINVPGISSSNTVIR